MNFLYVIGVLVVLEYIYYLNMGLLSDFINNKPLNKNNKDISNTVRRIIFLVALSHIPSIFQYISISLMAISMLIMHKYISVQNKTLNENNPELQAFYSAEIKRDIKEIIICSVIVFAFIIIFNYIINNFFQS